MGREFVGLALPGQTAEALQAPHGELVEVALDAATGDIGQACDLLVRKALALEPQDLHLLLDTGMGMVVTLVAEGVEVFGSEGETAHEEPQCSGRSAAHYEFRPRLAIVPDSYVSSITSLGGRTRCCARTAGEQVPHPRCVLLSIRRRGRESPRVAQLVQETAGRRLEALQVGGGHLRLP